MQCLYRFLAPRWVAQPPRRGASFIRRSVLLAVLRSASGTSLYIYSRAPGRLVLSATRHRSRCLPPPLTLVSLAYPCRVWCQGLHECRGSPAPYDTPPGFGCVPVTGGFPGQVVGLQKSPPFRCFSSQSVEKRNIFATIGVISTKTTSKRGLFTTSNPVNSTNFFVHIDFESRKWYYIRAENVGLCLTTLYCYRCPA